MRIFESQIAYHNLVVSHLQGYHSYKVPYLTTTIKEAFKGKNHVVAMIPVMFCWRYERWMQRLKALAS